jgi:hypothetical protein
MEVRRRRPEGKLSPKNSAGSILRHAGQHDTTEFEGSMVQVYRILVRKERLRAMSRDERVLLLLLGYVSNQLSMLQKLLTFATNRTPAKELEQHASGAQTQMLVRLTVGALNEAWELVRTRFIETTIAKDYLNPPRCGRAGNLRGAQTPVW